MVVSNDKVNNSLAPDPEPVLALTPQTADDYVYFNPSMIERSGAHRKKRSN